MPSNINKIAKSIKESIQTDKGTKAYDTAATVTRVEGKTAWVHIPGGVDETPVKLTMNAKKGETVQVRVSGGKAWLTGNASAPPTDDTVAIKADVTATTAKRTADSAVAEAVRAKDAADRAETSAQEAQTSAANASTAARSAQNSADSALVSLSTVEDVVGVLNWITAHGTMTLTSDVAINPAHVYFVIDPAGDYEVGGTHYSIVSEPKVADLGTYYELSVDESVQNYVATHLVVDTEGLWLVPDSGGNKVLISTGAGTTYTTAGTYIIGKVNGLDTVFAQFVQTGATMRTKDSGGNNVEIVHLGYGPGTNSGGGTSSAPYYTIGVRSSGSTVGNYSVAEGYDTKATGYTSHAEGYKTNANSIYSHAEGSMTTTSNNAAHAEGYNTNASGTYSHAEGSGTTASDNAAHAEGSGTTASGEESHAEGISTTASGNDSHAEGTSTTASERDAHAEGYYTTASEHEAHAEGYYTTASGRYSHAQNCYTTAQRKSQTALGEFNLLDTAGTTTTRGDYAVIVGNGTATNARSNALTVKWDGETELKGLAKITTNSNTVTIGSQNSSWCHIYNSANVPFMFNKGVNTTNGGDLGTSTYKWGNLYMSGTANIGGDVNIGSGKHYKINGTNLSASDVGAFSKSNMPRGISMVSTIPSDGKLTLNNTDIGGSSSAKIQGVLAIPQYSSGVTIKHNYDSSSTSQVVLNFYKADGSAYSGAMRYFLITFPNTWTP